MSDYTIGIVVEGPTDRIVIEAALQSILAGKTYTLTQLQPESSEALGNDVFGTTGTGWGGVYQFCRQIVSMGEGLANHPSLRRYDFLIIHLDADVAEKKYSDANITMPPANDLPCVKPCPPADDTVQALKRVVLGWLSIDDQHPRSFVMCIPSKCTEAWVGTALYGCTDGEELNDIECKHDIENYLAQKPAGERLIRNRGGKMKKIVARYSEKSDQIRDQWGYVTRKCEQALLFTEDITALI